MNARLTTNSRYPVPVVVLEGALDLVSATAVERLAKDALDGAPGLLLDLRRVTHLDALGVQSIFNVQRAAGRCGKRFGIVDAVRPLRRELAACQVHRAIPVFPTLTHASEWFAPMGEVRR